MGVGRNWFSTWTLAQCLALHTKQSFFRHRLGKKEKFWGLRGSRKRYSKEDEPISRKWEPRSDPAFPHILPWLLSRGRLVREYLAQVMFFFLCLWPGSVTPEVPHLTLFSRLPILFFNLAFLLEFQSSCPRIIQRKGSGKKGSVVFTLKWSPCTNWSLCLPSLSWYFENLKGSRGIPGTPCPVAR